MHGHLMRNQQVASVVDIKIAKTSMVYFTTHFYLTFPAVPVVERCYQLFFGFRWRSNGIAYFSPPVPINLFGHPTFLSPFLELVVVCDNLPFQLCLRLFLLVVLHASVVRPQWFYFCFWGLCFRRRFWLTLKRILRVRSSEPFALKLLTAIKKLTIKQPAVVTATANGVREPATMCSRKPFPCVVGHGQWAAPARVNIKILTVPMDIDVGRLGVEIDIHGGCVHGDGGCIHCDGRWR